MEGVKCLAEPLPIIVNTPSNLYNRTAIQHRAFFSDVCLGSVVIALHNKHCHTLDRSFNLPHSVTHTIIFSHILEYNAPSISKIIERLGEFMLESNGGAIHGLNVLLRKLDVEHGLADFGFKEDGIDKTADLTVESSYYNS
ncbi:hypothetical protein BOTNAR_0388g00040 [Botryotinia narcissicola]|uniref:Fe-containing alcohol dehydrogenase-like C-terminal domain-containing protein n=1 Tax=Botryotinia narcissicola TaxID=278944 RepID=A0A4Z1I0Q5_9HELO|nr:hypothetical protein BOTNAR_0388g00040 [Botryotinia narcissicola]